MIGCLTALFGVAAFAGVSAVKENRAEKTDCDMFIDCVLWLCVETVLRHYDNKQQQS